jgi:hypothetical protein
MNNNYQNNGNGYQNRGGNQNRNQGGQSEQRIYVGNAKEIKRKDGSSFISATICLDDVDTQEAQSHVFTGKNGKRYLKVVVNPFRDGANQFGNTHSIAVDTFKPDANYQRNNGGSGNGYGNNGNYTSDPYNNSNGPY